MKFGGTSVASVERLRHVARIIQHESGAGHEIVVLVSAMAGETDRLVSLCHAAGLLFDPSEYDVVVSSGEQVTSGLLALALQAIGCQARSWQGWQLPLQTDCAHSKAKIVSIDPAGLRDALSRGEIAVLAGFQGVTADSRISTLGRGGTDTSAVAIAAALEADRCDIYTDVDGVYTTDPRIVAKAQKLKAVSYEEMLELASVGSKVLQTRAVGLAMRHKVRVQVLTSFVADPAPHADSIPGTLVVGDEEIGDLLSERPVITGIALDKHEAKFTLTRIADHPGAVAAIFDRLAKGNIMIDMIIQDVARESRETDVTFTVNSADLPRAKELMLQHKDQIGYSEMTCDTAVAKVSVVGLGMKHQPGVAATMFQALADRGINIRAIATSEIKTSVLIHSDEAELAVRALHTAYGLDAI
jgi:aspartate kinase